MNVVVMSTEDGVGDSVKTILERDFRLSGWVRPLPVDSSAIAIVVKTVLLPRGLRVTLTDGETGRDVRTGEFLLPSVATADSLVVSDSLSRDLAAKEAVTKALLQHNVDVADSLRRAQARRSSFWWPTSRERFARAQQTRDSLLRVLAHADADIRARAHQDSAQCDSVRLQRLQHVSTQRDSLIRAWRWALHGVADRLSQWITGHQGIAQSRVAYVSNGELRLVDADGANDHAVVRGETIMSPSWRHDGKAVIYSSLGDAGARIVRIDLLTGIAAAVAGIPGGLNITPVYSPNDQSIIFAHGTEHGTDLVAVPATGGAARRIVADGHDSEGPSFSPDGRRIAFSTAKARTPQIYSVKVDGTDERLETPIPTVGRSYRTSPDWSPDGRAIVFEQQNGNFQLWMVTRATGELRRLTSEGENEDPSWAPDGRHIVYTCTQKHARHLCVMDVDTGNSWQLTSNGGGRLAAWSPMID